MVRHQLSSGVICLILFIPAVVSSENSWGVDIYVPGDYGTIQAAIIAANDYDRVIVADGVYSGNNYFYGKKIEVTSENGPGNCIIAVTNWNRGFRFQDGEDPNSILDGFTIIGHGRGYGIYCYNSNPTIRNCFMEGLGYGIYCNNYTPLIQDGPVIQNCIITGNRYGIRCYYEVNPIIINSTINNNWQDGISCGSNYADLLLVNCIIRDNKAGSGAQIELWGTGTLTVSHCNIEGGEEGINLSSWEVVWGDGNIDTDPNFVFTDDYHIQGDSSCVDEGTETPWEYLPLTDMDGNARILDGNGDTIDVPDIGAYEFNPETPCLAISPAHLSFQVMEGEENPEDQYIQIKNCGGDILAWETQDDYDWLATDPNSGGAPAQTAVSIDAAGLTHDRYDGELIITDTNAVNSPRRVTVALGVNIIIPVPTVEYPTIQSGIDAAIDGDTILVADGTYSGDGNGDLYIDNKSITVLSENGAGSCVIDGSEEEWEGGIYIYGEDTSGSIVEGFSVVNFPSTGITCEYSSPTIKDCVIGWNGGYYSTGGIHCYYNSSPVITGCKIIGNYGRGYYNNSVGGIKCTYYSNPTIINCEISGNQSEDGAGGIYSGGYYGGNCKPIIINSKITNNHTPYRGGGIFSENGEIKILNSVISGNSADGDGGGIYFDNGELELTNCLLSGNSTWASGGALSINQTNLLMTNCTVTDNLGWYGSQMTCSSSSEADIKNSIFWSSQESPWPAIGILFFSSVDVSYSNIQDGVSSVETLYSGGLNWGEGNIDIDPRFADPGSWTGPYWIDGDYHLRSEAGRWDPDSESWVYDMATSPCIDAGDPASDWSGELCLNGGRINMGAYGGTAQASHSMPDLNRDKIINLADYSKVAAKWLEEQEGLIEDLNCDGVVDILDLGILVDKWLWGQ